MTETDKCDSSNPCDGFLNELLLSTGEVATISAGPFESIKTGSSSSDGRAAVVADFSGDGTANDIYVANNGQANELLLGDGDGGFTPVTTGAAVSRTDISRSVVVGDFSGDGTGPANDIYVANSGQANELLLNNGAGVFTAVTTGAAVSRMDSSRGAVVGDFTGDGTANDIYVLNFGTIQNNQMNELLLNNNAGVFTAATTGAAVNHILYSNGAVVGDFTGDGTANDIYILTTAYRHNALLLSDGAGGFTAITTGESCVADTTKLGRAATQVEIDACEDIANEGVDPFPSGGTPESVEQLCTANTDCTYTAPPVGTALARTRDSVGGVVGDFTGDGAGPATQILVLNVGMGGSQNELLLPRGHCQADKPGSSYAGDGYAARVTTQGTICCAS